MLRVLRSEYGGPRPSLLQRARHRIGRYAVVRQYDQVDCGPAALLTVLRYWGGDDSLVHVRELARTGARGSSLLDIVTAASKLGFEAKGAAGEYDDLRQEPMPCIAHVIQEDNRLHYVVIFRIDENGVLIGDPGMGLRRLSRDEFKRMWVSRAVALLRPTPHLQNRRAPNWFQWIATYFHVERTWLIQSLFLGGAATVLGLLTAVFIQFLIDRFIPAGDTRMIVATGVILLGMLFLRAFAGYLRHRFVVQLNKRVGVRVNLDFLAHLFRLPLRFFESRKTGDITSRIADSVRIQNALLEISGTGVMDGLVILGSLVFLFALAPPLGWIALATLPLYAALMIRATFRLKREQNEVMKGYAQVEASYIDALDGIETILSFNVPGVFTRMNTLLFGHFQDRTERLGLTKALIGLFAELAGGLLIMASLIWSAFLVVEGRLQLGQMIAGYSLLAGMLPSIDRLVRANIILQEAAVAATRLMDMLLVSTEPETGDESAGFTKSLEIVDGRYQWSHRDVLFDGLNLVIPRGRITGLWGPSGAGKSTLVKILNRTYELTSGEVRIDGRPVADVSLALYRRNVAVVPDQVKIFSGTLADNVLIGRDSTESRERIEALKLGPFLSRFEHGWATAVGEDGRRLSGGERQVVGLIRALIDEPAVLLVDEGINSADVELTGVIMDMLVAYAKAHAVLLISHDLRVLIHVDHLYLLEDGRIVSQGSPQALLSSSERFSKLWQIQNPKLPVGV